MSTPQPFIAAPTATLTTVSVLIVSRDRPADLRRAVTSVFAQTLLPVELLVVDDGSQPPVATDIFADAPRGLPCRLLRNPAAQGANAARNRGIEAACGDHIAFLDDDDEFFPTKLARLQPALGDADLVYHRAEIVYDSEGLSYLSGNGEVPTLAAMLLGNGVGGTSVVCVRKAFFQALGGFDPALPALQDYEAWLRATLAGARFRHVPAVLTRYHYMSGKPAISKDMHKLATALALIAAKHRDHFATLSPRQHRHLQATNRQRFAHRHAMRGERWQAAWWFARGFAAGGGLAMLLAACAAPFGLRALIGLRALRGGAVSRHCHANKTKPTHSATPTRPAGSWR